MFEEGLGKKLFAEYVGAFIVTASVIFPAIALRDAGLGAFLFIMFTAGMGIAIATWLFRDVSGAQVNPAVTFAMMLTRKTSVAMGILYWIVQMAGGLGAAMFAQAGFKLDSGSAADLANFGTALPTQGYHDYQIVMMEAIGVFLLVSVVLAVSKMQDKVLAGLAIGFALLVGVVMTAPVSGGALNPAREFGPMFAAGVFKPEYVWYYLVGPALGALVAVVVNMLTTDGFNFAMPQVKRVTTRSRK